MSDTLEQVVRREVYHLVCRERDDQAAAVIRTYGDERYQAAIADVVEWLGEMFDDDNSIDGMIWRNELSNEITRRFGKGQDQNPVK
jgi:DNA polymerase III alpha subunit